MACFRLLNVRLSILERTLSSSVLVTQGFRDASEGDQVLERRAVHLDTQPQAVRPGGESTDHPVCTKGILEANQQYLDV